MSLLGAACYSLFLIIIRETKSNALPGFLRDSSSPRTENRTPFTSRSNSSSGHASIRSIDITGLHLIKDKLHVRTRIRVRTSVFHNNELDAKQLCTDHSTEGEGEKISPAVSGPVRSTHRVSPYARLSLSILLFISREKS